MNNKVTINSKDYTFKTIDFNGICELEDLGLSIDGIKKGKMNACRALLAYHGNMTSDEAKENVEMTASMGYEKHFYGYYEQEGNTGDPKTIYAP